MAAALEAGVTRLFRVGGAHAVAALEDGCYDTVTACVPVLTPRLSSLWLGLVTPIYARVGRKLIDSMTVGGTLRGSTDVRADGRDDPAAAARLGARGKARLIPDTATATAAVSWLEDGGFLNFDRIVIDGLGTIQNKALLSYAAEAWDANPAKRTHRNLPDKPDYFNAQNFIKGWVARLIDVRRSAV